MLVSPKIQPLASLAPAVAAARGAGETVVHCHGVFDLLHIGHVRYLQRARQLGGRLLVTVTPDRWVNKGPHRPVFEEGLRAEALAALDCVDWVAINEWPTAVETIALLRPTIYAKGIEYRDRRTPEIEREEAAVATVGTRMEYIEDITSSSSHLINRFLSPHTDEVNRYLEQLGKRYTPAEIMRYLESTRRTRALVVGETIIDEYHYGQSLGRSANAPIVAMQYQSHERFAGGAAAVANHLASFCDEVTLLSMVGSDDDEEPWIRAHLKPNVRATFLRKSASPTIVKRRFRESYYGQPLFEIYHLSGAPLTAVESAQLYALLQAELPLHDLVLAADYGHTMLGPEAIELLSQDARFLAVNTQANAGNLGYHTISKYPRADYVSLAEQELRLECRGRTGELQPMLMQVAAKLVTRRSAVTRGAHGCICLDRHGMLCVAPALATKVVDRTGAGDAFLALSSLCAVQHAPLEIMAFLGNVAGAEAVATIGTGTAIDPLALSRHVESLLK